MIRSRLLGAAMPVTTSHICPSWGCGPNPPVFRVNVPSSSNGSSSPSGTDTSRSWQSRARRGGYQNSPQYQAYQQWLATQGANSPSTAYGSTIQNYDASGNPIYSVAPSGQVIIGYDAQGNPVYGAPTQSAAAPAPSTVNVSTPATPSSYQSILDWFTDPNQELISGVQNWMVVAGAGAAWLFLSRRNSGRGR